MKINLFILITLIFISCGKIKTDNDIVNLSKRFDSIYILIKNIKMNTTLLVIKKDTIINKLANVDSSFYIVCGSFNKIENAIKYKTNMKSNCNISFINGYYRVLLDSAYSHKDLNIKKGIYMKYINEILIVKR